MKLIKYIILAFIIFIIIGGGVVFSSNADGWSMVILKENIFVSIKDGVLGTYEFIKNIFNNDSKLYI